MLMIAGVTVQRGDRLYSSRAGAFGTIIDLGENIGTLRVERPQGHRDFLVEQGGTVAGQRDVFWHAPLQLDLPKGLDAKRGQIEAVVATLLQVL
jgi:hypothetical protein